MSQHTEPAILDVRVSHDAESISTAISSLRTQVLAGLTKPPHQRSLPTLLLYDERGLRLYDELTTHVYEYYLFGAEEQILRDYSRDIVKMMGIGRNNHATAQAIVMELGAGSLRKTSHILLSLADAVQPSHSSPPIQYFALDLERNELVRVLNEVTNTIGQQLENRVATAGMWGTYDGGIAFVKDGGLSSEVIQEPDPSGVETPCIGGKTGDFERGRPLLPDPSRRSPSTSPSRSSISDAPTSPLSSIFQPNPSQHGNSTNQTPPSLQINTSRPSSPAASDTKGDSPPLHILFLGSSIGNFSRSEAVEFLRGLPLQPGNGDTLLLGLDHRNDGPTVESAYNDPRGVTKKFIMNGLRGAERTLKGQSKEEADRSDWGDIFAKDGWDYYGKWNEQEGRHEGYYRSLKRQEVVIPPDIDRPNDPSIPVKFEENEIVNVEYSYKYSTVEAYALFAASKLRPVQRWMDATGRYSIWLLERPPFSFWRIRTPASLTSISEPNERLSPTIFRELGQTESFSAVPTLAEWSTLWNLWDTITLRMIPPSMLHQKPIDLRHKCLFYLGHIPAFLDIQLSRALNEAHTEPVYYKDIFERGIDPHVDDPTQCHAHSAVPSKDEEWPTLEEIILFRDRVRARLIRVYETYGEDVPGTIIKHFSRSLGRVLWMTYEHEAFHAETLLYMLIQRAGTTDGTLPPPAFSPPAWPILAKSKAWSKDVGIVPTVTIEPTSVLVGNANVEADDALGGTTKDVQEFGWDNESPPRKLDVGQVEIETIPVLNGQYYRFWEANREILSLPLPGSWVECDGQIQVRTLYGPIPFNFAKNWPFIGSYDEINAFAKSKNGRLPTEAELVVFRDLYEGSEESNYGFRNWHPIPPTSAKGDRRGHNGGVWEWTSTPWDTFEGFQPSQLYPGYSADFFDGMHHVVIGSSYATVPRLAQRRSLRNWYQHNYPYAWIGGRIAYSIYP